MRFLIPANPPAGMTKDEPSMTSGGRDIPGGTFQEGHSRPLPCAWGMNPMVGTGALLERSLTDL